jgi:hypothetical protein
LPATSELSASRRSIQWQIGVATFAILVLELALIRWTSQQVRVFAYFNNLTLMAAFLGMGLGVAIGGRRPGLQHWTLPILALLSILLGFSERLKIVYLQFPDLSISLWQSESLPNAKIFGTNLMLVLLIFVLIVAVFMCAGSIVGRLFTQLPPLEAYSADLLGSLLGVIVMTAIAGFGASPPIWFAVATLPFLFFSRKIITVVAFAGVIVMAWISVGSAQFSPYYRIDLTRDTPFAGKPLQLSVNRDFHQILQNLSDKNVSDASRSPSDRMMLRAFRILYDVPYHLTPMRDRALVVGAGTGNDASGALRAGFREVVSVDIDPLIMRIGKEQHPEHPYDDPRAIRVVNDGRAYFEQHPDARFDVVSFGLLDSHAMFSSMSSLRLDNYIYTVQSMQSAWRMVKPGGVLTVSFSTYAGEWISDRLYSIIWDATGVPPIVVLLPMHFGRMYIVGKQIPLIEVVRRLPFPIVRPGAGVATIRVPTDDWPFLYIRPGTIPSGYIAVIASLLVVSFVGARLVYGKDLFTREHFDLPLFLMGAAFLLIETRGVVNLSLLFGSTWLVNSAVFAGILLMAYLANWYVKRYGTPRLDLMFILLFGALLLNYFFAPSTLLQLPLWLRGTIGGILNALPVGFAGVIFSSIFSRSTNTAASLGSNLLGAVIGGCLEYLSLLVGLRALALLALAIYLTVMFVARRPSLRGTDAVVEVG